MELQTARILLGVCYVISLISNNQDSFIFYPMSTFWPAWFAYSITSDSSRVTRYRLRETIMSSVRSLTSSRWTKIQELQGWQRRQNPLVIEMEQISWKGTRVVTSWPSWHSRGRWPTSRRWPQAGSSPQAGAVQQARSRGGLAPTCGRTSHHLIYNTEESTLSKFIHLPGRVPPHTHFSGSRVAQYW